MIGLDRAVLGVDGAALHQRQEIALDALARHVRADGFLTAGDLVDFVDEDDAVLLGILHGADLQLFFIDDFRGFFIEQKLRGILDLELALARAPAAQALKHALQLLRHLLHARRRHDLDPERARAHVDFDLALVEFALAQHLAKALPGVAVPRRSVLHEPRLRAGQEHIEDALLGCVRGPVAHFCNLLLASHFDGDLDKIADDRINFTPNIAQLQ